MPLIEMEATLPTFGAADDIVKPDGARYISIPYANNSDTAKKVEIYLSGNSVDRQTLSLSWPGQLTVSAAKDITIVMSHVFRGSDCEICGWDNEGVRTLWFGSTASWSEVPELPDLTVRQIVDGIVTISFTSDGREIFFLSADIVEDLEDYKFDREIGVRLAASNANVSTFKSIIAQLVSRSFFISVYRESVEDLLNQISSKIEHVGAPEAFSWR